MLGVFRTIPRTSKDTLNRFKRNLVIFLFSLVFAVSNISQIPLISELGLSSAICIVAWLILLAVTVVLSPNILFLGKTKGVFVLSAVFILFLLFLTFAFGNRYFSSSVYSLFISLLALFLGIQITQFLKQKDISIIFLSYAISAFVVAIIVYFDYFYGKVTLDSRIYAYDSKNSLSQILLSAIILIIFYIPSKKALIPIKLLACLFLLFLIVLMRSRATILGIFVIAVALLFSKKTTLRFRILLISALLVLFFFYIINPSLFNPIINNVLLAGRSISDLNDLSSGRINIIKEGLILFNSNIFSGIGSYYLDCFPISALLQFGIFGGSILILISLSPIVSSIHLCFKKVNKTISYCFLGFLLISISYTLNGLFEGLTPFGPGVKCYLLWFMLGFYSNYKENYSKQINELEQN